MALLASEKPEHLLYTQANDLLFHQVKLSITHTICLLHRRTQAVNLCLLEYVQ